MNEQEKGMDRREFIKTSLAAAGGLALTSWMGHSAWAQTTAFGDLADPNSRVAQLARSKRAFRILEDMGSEPAVIYLKGGESHAG